MNVCFLIKIYILIFIFLFMTETSFYMEKCIWLCGLSFLKIHLIIIFVMKKTFFFQNDKNKLVVLYIVALVWLVSEII